MDGYVVAALLEEPDPEAAALEEAE